MCVIMRLMINVALKYSKSVRYQSAHKSGAVSFMLDIMIQSIHDDLLETLFG